MKRAILAIAGAVVAMACAGLMVLGAMRVWELTNDALQCSEAEARAAQRAERNLESTVSAIASGSYDRAAEQNYRRPQYGQTLDELQARHTVLSHALDEYRERCGTIP